MKCPKCGYVGFEDTEKCRHCSYDFALLHAEMAAFAPAEPLTVPLPRIFTPAARAERLAHDMVDFDMSRAPAPGGPLQDLPLAPVAFPVFVPEAPAAARTPLAVRRAAAERPRSRPTTRIMRRPSAPLLDAVPEQVEGARTAASAIAVAPSGLRLAAAVLDVTVLAGIDLAVVYLTVQLTGLPFAEVATLPLVPLGAFLLGLNVAYLAVFTASGGQTLGKMAMGLRVEALSGGLSASGALVRVGVALAGSLVAGAGFLPALMRTDGRALHDYAARTRVVKVEA